MDNFKVGQKVVCIKKGQWVDLQTGHSHDNGPKYGEVLPITYIVRFPNHNSLQFGKFKNERGELCFQEQFFVPIIEDHSSQTEYKVVEIEIDKRVKEKREEVIFNN